MRYLNDGSISGAYSKRLEQAVNDIKSNEERRLEYMNMAIHEMEIRDEAFEEGVEQEQQKTLNILVNFLRNGILTPEQAAAIARMSVNEFIEKMNAL